MCDIIILKKTFFSSGSWNHGLYFITCCENVSKFFFFFFLKNKFDAIHHDVHVCIFTMIYMFVNFIFPKDINASIHQGLDPRPHGSTPRFSLSNHFQNFINKGKKVKVYCCWHEIV